MMDFRSTKDLAELPHLPRVPEHIADTAFLLDFDGTLVDIAPTPDLVTVRDGLINVMHRIRARNGDALAIISGRRIDEIDHFLPGVPYAVSGEHGHAFRPSPDAMIQHGGEETLPSNWLEAARSLADAFTGILLEAKRNGFVLHYRNAPDLGPKIEEFAQQLIAGRADYHLQPAKMAWEIRPSGFDKGRAVEDIMARAPFKGKLPIFVGDDRTDLDGVRAAQAMGGTGYLIPQDFPSAAAFRSWLHLCAGETK